MANKRISELSARTPSATDLMVVGDPTTGYSYKCLVSEVGGVTSVFGRTGAVTAAEGDYSLTLLSDVTITSPASGDILSYNGSSWVNSAGGFVPYTGATGNVTLGEYGMLAGWYRLDLTPTGTPTDQGTMYWDDNQKTLALIMNGTTQKVGHDQYYYVKNSSGSTIAKGTAVRFAGTDGNSGHLLIAPFLADGSNPSSYFMGVTSEEITNGSFGKVQSFGRLDGIDTSAYSDGDILYASTTVAGGFQTTVPVAPNNIVQVAAVVAAANNGKLLVRPTLGSKLTSDESVKLTSVANGQVLQYNSTLSVWENVAPTSLAVSNIYTANGTLTGNRTVSLGNNQLTFGSTGNAIVNVQSAAPNSAYLQVQNGANGISIFSFNNQAYIGKVGTNSFFGISGMNVGINTTTDAGFRLYVGGNTRIFGDAYISNRVGIGTTGPAEELHVLGTIRAQALTGSDNIFLEGINSIGSRVGEIREGSSIGSGGLLVNGQRDDNTNGNGVFFNGFVGTTASGNNAALEFRGTGGTIASPADLPNGIPIAIFSKRSGSATVTQMALFQTGNLLLQNGGTFTDAGFRLDVNGTIATNNFINFTANGASGFRSSSSTVSVEIYGGRDVTNGFRWGYSSTMNVTNSTRNLLTFGETFLTYTYAGGTNIGRIINFSHIINTTGGTNTITAIYYNPTLTSTTGTTHRFLHNITGDVLLCTTSGYVGIGATADTSYKLSVDGDLRVYGNIRTAQPTGGTGVGVWRLGSTATGIFTLDATTCVEIEIGGTLYKLATVS